MRVGKMRVGKITAIMMSCAVAGVLAQGAPEMAKAELKMADGTSVGMAMLTETPHGVLIHVVLTAAPEGVHAFHVHTTGKCDAPAFMTAGGHFNPTAKQHGAENAMGMHAGDMANVTVPAGGKLTFDVLNADVTLKAGPNSLMDADGSALMLHATADDYKGDPAGNAGARIACGVITK
jgi:superoxide dismutase, Cu-Zn family